jgi:hypothetical protein
MDQDPWLRVKLDPQGGQKVQRGLMSEQALLHPPAPGFMLIVLLPAECVLSALGTAPREQGREGSWRKAAGTVMLLSAWLLAWSFVSPGPKDGVSGISTHY